MIAELITPLLIATTPAQIHLPAPIVYSHEQQTNISTKGEELAYRQPTFNGTQTFDWNGRPSDNDSD